MRFQAFDFGWRSVHRGRTCRWVAQRITAVVLAFVWRSGSPRSCLPLGGAAVYRGRTCRWVAQRFAAVVLAFGWRSGLPRSYLPLGGAAVHRCDDWPFFIAGFSR